MEQRRQLFKVNKSPKPFFIQNIIENVRDKMVVDFYNENNKVRQLCFLSLPTLLRVPRCPLTKLCVCVTFSVPSVSATEQGEEIKFLHLNIGRIPRTAVHATVTTLREHGQHHAASREPEHQPGDRRR